MSLDWLKGELKADPQITFVLVVTSAPDADALHTLLTQRCNARYKQHLIHLSWRTKENCAQPGYYVSTAKLPEVCMSKVLKRVLIEFNADDKPRAQVALMAPSQFK